MVEKQLNIAIDNQCLALKRGLNSNFSWISLLLFIFILFGVSEVVKGQNEDKETQNLLFIETIHELLQTSEQELLQANPEKAMSSAFEVLNLSHKYNYIPGKAESLGLLGRANKKLNKHHEALRYYLWAIKTFEIVNKQAKIAKYYQEIGLLYLEMRAYKQSKEYFLLYKKASEKENINISNQIDFLHNMAFLSLQLQEYDEAVEYYSLVSEEYKKQKDTINLVKTYQTLSYISRTQDLYEDAIVYNTKLLEIYQKQQDIVSITDTYNNIGFLYKRTNNLKAALEYFNNGIALSQKHTQKLNEEAQVALFTNIGIAYTNLSLFLHAKEYFLQALKIRKKQEDVIGKAHMHNHLASNYLIGGKISLALKEVMTAVDVGVTYDAKEVLITSYKILSLIYKANNTPGEAQIYENKHREIMEHLEEKKKAEARSLLQKQIEVDKKEDEIKALLLEEEQNDIEKERKENELILKEKELAILKRDQELKSVALQNQQLEKEKAEQALVLARQQLQAEIKNMELKELEKQKQLQDLILKQQMLEKEQQEKAIALLEADKKLKDQKLHEEIMLRKYAYGIIGLFLLILGITVISFRQKQIDNRKLQTHQVVIQEKNNQLEMRQRELRRSVVALQATKETLAVQKRELEIENKKTQESIQYAKRIQFSILPSEALRNSIIPESFILYKPKDIVSGDFYWISKNNDLIFVSVIDCTGHGVPGALVSLIGHNILNEAINEYQLTDPAEILQYMDKRIRIKLKLNEEDIKDGMDLGLCILEPMNQHYFKLSYGGAKNTLFIVKDNELLTVKGDRRSIGGSNQYFEFSKQEVVLKKGDAIYLTTDGYIDQANPKRERLGSTRFKSLIEDIHQVNMAAQKIIFEQALKDHQLDTEQRDDINLIGVRV